MKKFILFLSLGFSCICNAQIIINEIMYNPPETGGDTTEYVELYNAGSEDVDLTGYFFSDGVGLTITDAIIPSKGFIVFSDRPSAVQAIFGVNSIAWSTGALNNAGENLELSAPDSTVVDFVDYDDNDGWPTEPDGDGPSAELIATDLDNDLGINWKASTTSANIMIEGFEVKGSPGLPNSALSGIVRIANHLVSISPNPAQDVIRITSDLDVNKVEIYAANGQLMSKSNSIDRGESVDISNLVNGLYFLKVTTNAGLWQGKILKFGM